MDQLMATKDGRAIAAWVLKANPKVYDAVGALGDLGVVDSWSVHPTYRVDLMQAGQRVFLYLGTGGKDGHEPGIIGAGVITGPAFTAVGSNEDGRWADDDEVARRDRFVPVEILALANPIPRQALQADRDLSESELFRSPQQSNPVVLRPDELRALDRFDLTTLQPTVEQLERLATETASPDDDQGAFLAVALIDGNIRYGLEYGEDGDAWRLFKAHQDRDDFDVLDRYEEWADALDAVLALAAEVGPRVPIVTAGDAADAGFIDPVVVIEGADEVAWSIFRAATDRFLTAEVDLGAEDDADLVIVAEHPDLPAAIADCFSEVDD